MRLLYHVFSACRGYSGAKFWLLVLMLQMGFSGAVYAQLPMIAASRTGGFTIDTSNRDAVQLFYNKIFQSTVNVPSGWNGNVDNCVAGDTTEEYKNATLRRINWYRAMAGVPADIKFDDASNRKAQQAALLMAANSRLSHNPPPTWKCYSDAAADAARSSNLALGSAGASSISEYVIDWGTSNFPVGHRRWILYPQTQLMGTGDVDGNRAAKTNTLWVMRTKISPLRPPVRDEFVAWPPPGFVPYDTVTPRWSFSYPWADFSSATVSMKENGKAIDTRKEDVKTGYGENTLVWIPGGYLQSSRWPKPAADTKYEVILENVLIKGVPRTFNYEVTIFEPLPTGITPLVPGRKGMTSAYNGITPSASLRLPLNNIGIIDTADQLIQTCVAIEANHQPSTLNGVARFDIEFAIVSLEDGIVRVQNSRAFNPHLQTTDTGEQPSCSGTYDTVTKMYRDILVMDNETLNVEFYMHDEAALELQLHHADSLMHHY